MHEDNFIRNSGSGIAYTAVLSAKSSDELPPEPCTLDEAKDWVAIDGTDHDAKIEMLITAAREMIEHYINRSLISRTIMTRLKPGTELPYGGTITAIVVNTVDNIQVTDAYNAQGVFNTRYEGTEDLLATYDITPIVTTQLKIAVLQQVYYMFDNRGNNDATGLSPAVKSGLKSLRFV